MADIMVLVAPNIETIKNKTANANVENEQEKFEEIKTAIEEAAATGSYEVVIRENLDTATINGNTEKSIYGDLLRNAGYNVCVGKYNNTEKVCTLIEWRNVSIWEVENGKIVKK